ncbi:tRNA intron endonuclease [Phycomyces nitens]|nr:tRNA intron endonuclease [Phycomyces nitens]
MEPIVVHLCGSKPLVFDVKDVERLRCDHRMVGALVGTLPRLPLQNTFHGLPLLLMPEEVTLALSKNIIRMESWDYPKTAKDILKCSVYAYLWSLGFYITRGTKFGGDFLTYPGDPMRFHSHCIVEAVERDATFKAIELIGKGRLATNVKKTFVLASVVEKKDEDEKEEEVFTLSWAGF